MVCFRLQESSFRGHELILHEIPKGLLLQHCWRRLGATLTNRIGRHILELRTFYQYVASPRYMVR